MKGLAGSNVRYQLKSATGAGACVACWWLCLGARGRRDDSRAWGFFGDDVWQGLGAPGQSEVRSPSEWTLQERGTDGCCDVPDPCPRRTSAHGASMPD